MIKFYLMRGMKDWFGHLVLIIFPIILISFFYYIISQDIMGTETEPFMADIIVFLSIGFALVFQIYGSAISYEMLDFDFLTPMRNRLLSMPVIPVKLVFSILLSGIIVSFLQTLAVLVFSALVFDATYQSIGFVLLIMLLSIVFHHLMAAVVLFWTKKSKMSNAVLNLYAIIAPMLMGLYFSMPDMLVFDLFEKYLLPISLANTAIMGVINQRNLDVFIGVATLLLLSAGLLLLIRPLTRRVLAS